MKRNREAVEGYVINIREKISIHSYSFKYSVGLILKYPEGYYIYELGVSSSKPLSLEDIKNYFVMPPANISEFEKWLITYRADKSVIRDLKKADPELLDVFEYCL